jgi:hypothetical protein
MSHTVQAAQRRADATDFRIASADAHLARVHILIERIRSLLDHSDSQERHGSSQSKLKNQQEVVVRSISREPHGLRPPQWLCPCCGKPLVSRRLEDSASDAPGVVVCPQCGPFEYRRRTGAPKTKQTA